MSSNVQETVAGGEQIVVKRQGKQHTSCFGYLLLTSPCLFYTVAGISYPGHMLAV